MYSLKRCCRRFFRRLFFSFRRFSARDIWPAHRIWVTEGARNRGIDEAGLAIGRVAEARLSLASEARHLVVAAMNVGGPGVVMAVSPREGIANFSLQNFQSSGRLA